MAKKIYLSPSDQWSNIVADGEHSEAYHCTEIAKHANYYLALNGYETFLGANSKEGSYVDRAISSNIFGSDLHICIHTNAGGGEGTLMLCYPGSENNAYVKQIYEHVANLTPTRDRGIQTRTNLYEINNTNCVCAYLECEFHDNSKTEKWIDNNLKEIGKAIAKGVCVADGKTFIDTESNLPSTGTLYRVQVGAFKEKSNADALCNELHSKGYDAFVKVG